MTGVTIREGSTWEQVPLRRNREDWILRENATGEVLVTMSNPDFSRSVWEYTIHLSQKRAGMRICSDRRESMGECEALLEKCGCLPRPVHYT